MTPEAAWEEVRSLAKASAVVRQALDEAVDVAFALGVDRTSLAAALGLQRATLYRHMARRSRSTASVTPPASA